MAINNEGLDKTSGRLIVETDALLQGSIDRASDARNAGSGRSRGFASLIVLAAGLIAQSGGILALDKLGSSDSKPEQANVQMTGLTANEKRLVKSNLDRIKIATGEILKTRDRVAPSMPIDSGITSINSSASDLETVLLPVDTKPSVQ